MAWREQGGITEDAGEVGGEVQAGGAYSRHFVNDDIDSGEIAMVTVYTYVIRTEQDIRNGEWDVEQQVEYLTCTDSSDPGGTETWSGYTHDQGTVDGRVRHSLEAADEDARKRIGLWSAEDLSWWDGEPFDVRLLKS